MNVVMFVFNDCTTDARVLREAATLGAEGYSVTVIARPRDTSSTEIEREMCEGFEIVRVPIPGSWRRWWIWTRYPWRARTWLWWRVRHLLDRPPIGFVQGLAAIGLAIVTLPWLVLRGAWFARTRGLSGARTPGGDLADWLVRWRFAVLGWARRAAREAPAAAVYHGHDLTALPAAVYAAKRNGGRLIYDSHEIFLESGSNAGRPRWIRRVFAHLERRWTARAHALVTVNDSLAEELARRYSAPRIVVLHNTPPRWQPPETSPDLIRAATGIPQDHNIALYHGSFTTHRGIEQLCDAILLPDMASVHAVLMGYGWLQPELERRAGDTRFAGRLHVLPAVSPAELLLWVASADVGVAAIQPSTLNHRLSTPNKLFECLAAGVPIVASDFEEMRRIVVEEPLGPLGAVCDPADPAAIARAIRGIVSLPPNARAELRQRCLAAAGRRWNWEMESRPLIELYRGLTA
jgi:glycosyltransferase involved in cell wall biosynthesis